jgi:hypothetical protein
MNSKRIHITDPTALRLLIPHIFKTVQYLFIFIIYLFSFLSKINLMMAKDPRCSYKRVDQRCRRVHAKVVREKEPAIGLAITDQTTGGSP